MSQENIDLRLANRAYSISDLPEANRYGSHVVGRDGRGKSLGGFRAQVQFYVCRWSVESCNLSIRKLEDDAI